MSFRFLTAGESHGKALVGILEGMPAGLKLSLDSLALQMKRRKMGYGRGGRQAIETDEIEILSGVRFGVTLGSPISILLKNRDWEKWKEIMAIDCQPVDAGKVEVPRPGHADLVGGIKYNHRDMRNVLERSSARETAMRVALGSVVREFLEFLGISVGSRVIQVGQARDLSEVDFPIRELNIRADESPTRCLSQSAQIEMIGQIEEAKKNGDTIGGIFEVYADGLPIGLGSYVQWDRRLEAEIGKAFLSLNAIKGVEIGFGFKVADQFGSTVHDSYQPDFNGKVNYQTNHSGGIDGGMSTGQPLLVRAAMKPLSTLMKPLRSVHLESGESTFAHVERSDVCAVPAAAVIGESLLCLVLGQMILEKFGGDSMEEIVSRVQEWRAKSTSFTR